MSASDIDLPALLDVALRAAAAGAKVLERTAGVGLSIRTKGEAGNLVTDTDVAAEHAVRSVLLASRPLDRITGEELPDTEPDAAGIRWSIDPLDGTTNFVRGIPYFATSVGAVSVATGEWLVGAVAAPLLGRTYYASRGGGAWLLTNTGVRRLTGPHDRDDARILGTGISYTAQTRDTQYAQLPQAMTGFNDMRSLGAAALGICAVADGSLDGFVESDLGEYDWAAAALIAQEAGLHVLRPSDGIAGIRVGLPVPEVAR